MIKAAKTILRHAGRAAAGAIPAALLVGLGLPALGALVFLASAVLAVTCWVIASEERTSRVSQLMLARRGQAGSPAQGAAAVPGVQGTRRNRRPSPANSTASSPAPTTSPSVQPASSKAPALANSSTAAGG
jgi:hypothetical protein